MKFKNMFLLYASLGLTNFATAVTYSENDIFVDYNENGECSIGSSKIPTQHINDNKNNLRNLLGQWQFSSISDGYIVGGSGYGFEVKKGQANNAVCIKSQPTRNFLIFSKFGTNSNPESYALPVDFDYIDNKCQARNRYIFVNRVSGNGKQPFSLSCNTRALSLSSSDPIENHILSAYSTLSTALEYHEKIFGSPLFKNTVELLHQTSISVNSSYLKESDSFSIRTENIGLYGSAYVDFSTMAHEAGHADTKELLFKDGTSFYNSLKESLADMYSVLITSQFANDNFAVGDGEISWLIVHRATNRSVTGALRNLQNPQEDYPEVAIKHTRDIGVNNTDYQNGGVVRFTFYKLFQHFAADLPLEEQVKYLKAFYKAFKQAALEHDPRDSYETYTPKLVLYLAKYGREVNNDLNINEILNILGELGWRTF